MNKYERKHVGALERRRDFLSGLRDEGEANDWDKQEIQALNWVLKEILPEASLIRADKV